MLSESTFEHVFVTKHCYLLAAVTFRVDVDIGLVGSRRVVGELEDTAGFGVAGKLDALGLCLVIRTISKMAVSPERSNIELVRRIA